MQLEHVFKALADHHRRHILDTLAQTDGQTLTQLCDQVPELSRFGVMKHLGVLEQAGLISTRKVGRQKQHHLNAAALAGVDRWLQRYRQLWEQRLDRLEDYLRTLDTAEGADE